MELMNLEMMEAYLNLKFTGAEYKAFAHTNEKFGPCVRFTILWVPFKKEMKAEVGDIWVTVTGVTSSQSL